jgi:ribonucleoside-diphosphate reductase alpha chain
VGAGLETTEAELVETKAEHEAIDDLAPKPAPKEAHTSAELMERLTGTAVDSPLCMTCGTKMRPAGSCYVCEGCGSTSGCS